MEFDGFCSFRNMDCETESFGSQNISQSQSLSEPDLSSSYKDDLDPSPSSSSASEASQVNMKVF